VEKTASILGVSLRKRFLRPFRMAKAVWGGHELYLVEPLTFMNASGRAVIPVLKDARLAVSDIVVVCDSLDLSPGNCRLRKSGSAGGHKGLESIIRHIGTDRFMRLLIGIGRPRGREEVIEYVLSRAAGEESAPFVQGVDKAAQAVLMLLSHGPDRVMNETNRKEPSP
jgi:PTH1 family peptidyl-tRNA hydrolase